MKRDNESPEERRERLRQGELKKNPTGEFNSPGSGNLADLVGALGWKGTGLIIVILILAFMIYSLVS